MSVPLCEDCAEPRGSQYFLTLSDSTSHSNGLFVCSDHLVDALDYMLGLTMESVDVQAVREEAGGIEQNPQPKSS